MQALRPIATALVIVAMIFGVPVLATLLAGQIGLPPRWVGWITLGLMFVLAYRARPAIGRLLLGEPKLPPTRPRRSHKRF
jgi:hypothetical protein